MTFKTEMVTESVTHTHFIDLIAVIAAHKQEPPTSGCAGVPLLRYQYSNGE